jgi:hypothetical protein
LYSASLQQLAKLMVEAAIVEGQVTYKSEDTNIAF